MPAPASGSCAGSISTPACSIWGTAHTKRRWAFPRSDAAASWECALLRVDDVSFSYRGPAKGAPDVLNDVSFEAGRGTILGLLGPNGSGKTTLLRLMAGTLVPRAGRVTLDAVDVGRLARRELARRIAIVPEETDATLDFTVRDIVLMGRYPHLGPFELEGADDVAIARDALAATGTGELAARSFATLSGGEKQRVVI